MEITVAKTYHVSGIVEVWKEFMDSHKNIDPFFTRREDGHLNFEKLVKKLIKIDNFRILVALDKDQVVAYSISRVIKSSPVSQYEKYGTIAEMTIKSTYPKKDIDEKMFTEILNWFKSQDVSRVISRVIAKDQIGYSFWKKHGFEDYMHVLYLNR